MSAFFQFISFSEQKEKLMSRKEELDRGYKKIQVYKKQTIVATLIKLTLKCSKRK